MEGIAGSAAESFFDLTRNGLKFRLFMLQKLPAAYFSGLRVRAANENSCTVSIPYKWFTQNPFKSTYFACLSMAAEMSTGVLAMAHLYKRTPGVSMLVTGIEGQFFKKATGLTFFTCDEGKAILDAIQTAISSGQPQSIKVLSNGFNDSREMVAQFSITWSFKVRS